MTVKTSVKALQILLGISVLLMGMLMSYIITYIFFLPMLLFLLCTLIFAMTQGKDDTELAAIKVLISIKKILDSLISWVDKRIATLIKYRNEKGGKFFDDKE